MNKVATSQMASASSYPSIIECFRDELPNVHARDMWVNETYLELMRFDLLYEKGLAIQPTKNSLLHRLLTIVRTPQNDRFSVDGYAAYETLFGHTPTYCWTKDISDLTIESPTGGAPAVAWMRADGE